MCQAIKWQYKTFFDRRENIIKLLFSEIMFLKKCSKRANLEFEKQIILIALENIEILLNELCQINGDLSAEALEKILGFVYHTIKKVVVNLEL